MHHLLSTLLALCLLAAPAAAQTVKALSYNTTNGQIIAATNVVWTNAFGFFTNSVAAQVRTNLGLGWSALTNTNSANFRSAIGLGASDNVSFNTTGGGFVVGGTSRTGGGIFASFGDEYGTITLYPEDQGISIDIERASNVAVEQNISQVVTIGNIGGDNNTIRLNVPISWASGAENTRTNLGLGGGITTNITFVDASTNTNSVTISNGIITEWTQ